VTASTASLLMKLFGLAANLRLVFAQAMPHHLPKHAPNPLRDSLTDRHRDCLALASRGLSSSAIGEALSLSPRTVDEHFARACELLGVRTRMQAVALMAAMDREHANRSAASPIVIRADPKRQRIQGGLWSGRAFQVGLAAPRKPV